jgi:hypothetical protein
MGYDPIMSDYEDVLYDPRVHTHTSCVDEVRNCDILVLIIGARFGGKATIESLNRINFEDLKNESLNVDSLKETENLSVTQLEVLKAIEDSMPVYTFIDKKVWHDHALYEKNKSSDIIDRIVFPSIEKQETAKYIFNFINFVRLRTKGNNIFTFEKGQDIEEILTKQWSSYFQRLLNEQRYTELERKRIDILGEQFEDLKTAILSSIDNGDQREIARGIVRFRRMFDFLFALKTLESSYLVHTENNWEDLLKRAEITNIVDANEYEISFSAGPRAKSYLITVDRGYYEARVAKEVIDEMSLDWEAFIILNSKSREIIVDTLSEMARGMPFLRFVRRDFNEYIAERSRKYDEQLNIHIADIQER